MSANRGTGASAAADRGIGLTGSLQVKGLLTTLGGGDDGRQFEFRVGDIEAKVGSIVYVVGQNGSGKSCLLSLLSGDRVATPPGMSWSMDGTPLRTTALPCSVVRQAADNNLAMDLTVRENAMLRLSATDRRATVRVLALRAERLFDAKDALAGKLDLPAHALSVGERQRLAFSLAIVGENRVLLLDEFLSSVDARVATLLLASIRGFADSRRGCVFTVSHDLSQALERADRIVVLTNGCVSRVLDRGDPHWTIEELRACLDRDDS